MSERTVLESINRKTSHSAGAAAERVHRESVRLKSGQLLRLENASVESGL